MMTNYEYLKTLKVEEIAHIFAKLSYDSATEEEWLEWLNQPYEEATWKEALK